MSDFSKHLKDNMMVCPCHGVETAADELCQETGDKIKPIPLHQWEENMLSDIADMDNDEDESDL